MHIQEPDCGVTEALQKGVISKERYDSYLQLVGEVSTKKRY